MSDKLISQAALINLVNHGCVRIDMFDATTTGAVWIAQTITSDHYNGSKPTWDFDTAEEYRCLPHVGWYPTGRTAR